MVERLQGPQRVESDNFIIIANTLSNRSNKVGDVDREMCKGGWGWEWGGGGGGHSYKAVKRCRAPYMALQRASISATMRSNP